MNLRQWLAQQSKTRLATGAAALGIAATAPFGGWAPVAEPTAGEWQPEQVVTIGPFEFTVHKAVSLPDLEPIQPEVEGNRLLAVTGLLTNVEGKPRYTWHLTDAVQADGAGVVVENQDGSRAAPDLYYIEDSTEPTVLNPGMSMEVVLVFQQQPDLAGEVTLSAVGYDYIDNSFLTLDDDYWLPHERPDFVGSFPVEVKE